MTKLSSPSICNACLNCVRELEAAQNEHSLLLPHHQSIESFLTATKKPCLVCDYLQAVWCVSAKAEDFSTTCETLGVQEGGFKVHFNIEGKEPVLVSFVATDHEQAKSRYEEDLVPAQTSDQRALDVARSWMDYCQTNHPDCIESCTRQIYYPSNLIDLLPDGLSNDASWRLINNTSDLTGGYATLSHRWGRGHLEPFKLLKSTYEDMTKGLPDSCLSGTYRDAIRVVRKLGLRYIWIDSLCVWQDPGSLDTQVAAYRMAEVYGHSACNIAALTARQDTIFSSRDPLLHSPAAAMLPATVVGLQDSYSILLAKSWERSVLETPLSSRAWILQEQLLPKRMLYFGENQILWSCQEGAFCELYPLDSLTCDWLGDGLFQGDVGSLRSCLGKVIIPSTAPRTGGKFHETENSTKKTSQTVSVDWMDLLMLYGQRQLTFASDKLIAIAGIGQLLASVRKDELIGGLIRRELPESLLWMPDHNAARIGGYPSIVRSPEYRAPSWSWAYYDGPIAYYTGLGGSSLNTPKAVASVIKIKTETTVIDNVNIVKGGDLHLLGTAQPLEPSNSDSDHSQGSIRCWYMIWTTSSGKNPAPSTKRLKLSCNPVNGLIEDRWPEGFDGSILFDIADYSVLQEPLTAIFVTTSTSAPQGSNFRKLRRLDGLVLRRHPAREEGTFERVGMFAIQCSADFFSIPTSSHQKTLDSKSGVTDLRQEFIIC